MVLSSLGDAGASLPGVVEAETEALGEASAPGFSAAQDIRENTKTTAKKMTANLFILPSV
jgi:hypothetical protein